MSVTFEVAGLAGHFCTVQGELAWTGRDLKLAVQGTAEELVLVCQQHLTIGETQVLDATPLSAIVPETGAGASEPIQVTMVKTALTDLRVLRDCADRGALVRALAEFDRAPLRLVFPREGIAVDALASEPLREPNGARVVPMVAADLEFVPWTVFGIDLADVSAVLCLAGTIVLSNCDSSDCVAAVVLLTGGEILAGTAYTGPCDRSSCFLPVTVSAVRRAASVEALRQLLPDFVDAARGLPAEVGSTPIGPLRVSFDQWDLDGSFTTTLENRWLEGHLPRRGGRSKPAAPAILTACNDLWVPGDVQRELDQFGVMYSVVTAALDVVNSRSQGVKGGKKGKGKGTGKGKDEAKGEGKGKGEAGDAAGADAGARTWARLGAELREQVQADGDPGYELFFTHLAAAADAEFVPPSFGPAGKLTESVLASLIKTEKELVFGGAGCVDHKEWQRVRAGGAGGG